MIRTWHRLLPIYRAMVKLLAFTKIRTYAKSAEELWLDEWNNPLQRQLHVSDPSTFLKNLEIPIDTTEGDG
jgi:proteasome activator subunit 4